MKLGGGIDGREWQTPQEWLQIIKEMEYEAVYCPVDSRAPTPLRQEFKKLIKENGLYLGEVGAWVNPMAEQAEERKKNITYCQEQLALAEEMEAACCVNITGCRGEIWDGAYEDNYSADTYALAVDSIREIIDGVRPEHTFYTIEPMPWMIPDSPENYLKLLKDVDRKAFGVHLDYTNMINQPRRYVESSAFIRRCFLLLGPYIKSIHIKDIRMDRELPCVIREVMPGQGTIDLRLVLKLAGELGENITGYAEHLNSCGEYKKALEYLKLCR